jgi:hypothetical protein
LGILIKKLRDKEIRIEHLSAILVIVKDVMKDKSKYEGKMLTSSQRSAIPGIRTIAFRPTWQSLKCTHYLKPLSVQFFRLTSIKSFIFLFAFTAFSSTVNAIYYPANAVYLLWIFSNLITEIITMKNILKF